MALPVRLRVAVVAQAPTAEATKEIVAVADPWPVERPLRLIVAEHVAVPAVVASKLGVPPTSDVSVTDPEIEPTPAKVAEAVATPAVEDTKIPVAVRAALVVEDPVALAIRLRVAVEPADPVALP